MNKTNNISYSPNEARCWKAAQALTGAERRRRQAKAELNQDWQNSQYIIGRRMKHIRLESGIGLRAMSQLIRCTPPFLADLEAGRRNWSKKWIRAVERALSESEGESDAAPSRTDYIPSKHQTKPSSP